MEELNKIIGDLKNSINEFDKLSDEKKNLQMELRARLLSNWESIIEGEYREYDSLLKELTHKFNLNYTFTVRHFFGEYKSTYTISGVVAEGERRIQLRNNGYIYKLPIDYANTEGFMWLSTEDNAIKELNVMREEYLKAFTWILEQIEEKNSSLARQIQYLNETISNSSVVKEEEDGTIEIHLNGKTYKGTVVEE